jgi:leader peptidase (prepilin peptidase)/N-methyltransferase
LIQGAMTILPVLLWLFPGQTLAFPFAFLLLVYLTVVFVIDIEHRLILHPVSIIGAVIGFGIGIILRGRQSVVYGITSSLLGGVAGFGVMLVIYYLGELFIKQISKRRGISSDEVALGFGDVNLAGVLGLLLGWRAIFACLFFAIIIGGLVSLVIILRMVILKKYKSFTAIPYAPFLILSACYFLFL